MRITDSELRKRAVVGSDGQFIGQVDGLVLDTSGLAFEVLQVKLFPNVADQLGAGHSFFRPAVIEVPLRLVQSIADSVLLNVPAAQLRQGYAAGEHAPH
jgi:sporulation protein YlmC with PRC-barrel domain